MPVPAGWGARLKAARERAGLSQDAVATKVGVKQPTIQGLESGRQKGSTKILALCRLLKDQGLLPPFAPVQDDTDWRWAEAGRQLRQLAPDAMNTYLRIVEALVREAEERPPSQPPAEPSRPKP